MLSERAGRALASQSPRRRIGDRAERGACHRARRRLDRRRIRTGCRSGFQEASLGQLILRTETAVIAALASLNYALTEK